MLKVSRRLALIHVFERKTQGTTRSNVFTTLRNFNIFCTKNSVNSVHTVSHPINKQYNANNYNYNYNYNCNYNYNAPLLFNSSLNLNYNLKLSLNTKPNLNTNSPFNSNITRASFSSLAGTDNEKEFEEKTKEMDESIDEGMAEIYEKITKSEDITIDLENFPIYLSTETKKELGFLAKATTEVGNLPNLYFLGCEIPNSEEYLKMIAKALAKSISADFLSLGSVWDFLDMATHPKKSDRTDGRKGRYTHSRAKVYTIEQNFATSIDKLLEKTSRVVIYISRDMIKLLELESFPILMEAIAEKNKIILVSPHFESSDHHSFDNHSNHHGDEKSFSPIQSVLHQLPVEISRNISFVNVLMPASKAEFTKFEKHLDEYRKKEILEYNIKNINEALYEFSPIISEEITSESFIKFDDQKKILQSKYLSTVNINKIIHLAVGKAAETQKVDPNQLQINESCMMEAIKFWHSSNQKSPSHIKKLGLTQRETKFLPNLLKPGDIQIGYKDIGSLEKPKKILNELITLPIKRPEIFGKGLLKSSVPGILLFGPPGTGKSMLGKAVAMESGASFISITGGDLSHKYIGEGERNVKAIFSLARKMSPCVIFFDELDSLMRVRDQSTIGRRELVNEFMSEWDGITSRNQGIIVMGATNRPFDLDEAILRRMPRRILIDLPSKGSREQILRVILKDENLHSNVDLVYLSEMTKDYSGSDLKNLCHAAAFHAVRDLMKVESETNRQYSSQDLVLKMEHFVKSLDEVKPTYFDQSENASELRKWDTLYGDGSKRKAKSVVGFT